MRANITTLILIVSIMQVGATGFAQKLNFIQKDASLREVFRQIRKQTGYNVLYSDKQINDRQRVDANFKNAPLEEVLERSLRDKSLSFSIEAGTIFIRQHQPSFLDRVSAYLASIDVAGKVVDAQGNAIPGATINVKGSSKSVTSGSNGGFLIKDVDERATLVITYIGYAPKELAAAKDLGEIVLLQTESKLDEVQVIAYGTTTQRTSLGNVATVRAKDIEKQPVGNVLNALQGRVPGLFIAQTTGFSGGGVAVRIQGQNSMANGNNPFFVIDGVPYASQMMNFGTSVLGISAQRGLGEGIGNHGSNPLAFINPSDIESISVLKDADATAIYGSKAANGAILITTKKGKVGDTRLDLNLQQGIGKVAKKLDMMNTQQYLELRREAFKNSNRPLPSIITTPTDANYDINGHWDQNRYTDWQQELIGGNAKYTDLQASVSGGSEQTQFRFGSSYHRETTVFPTNYADQRLGATLSLSNSSKNKRFNLQFNSSYVYGNNRLPLTDFTLDAIQTPPNAPKFYNADGSLNWEPTSSGTSSWVNPLARMNNTQQLKIGNLVVSTVLSYKILEGLQFRTNLGFNSMNVRSIKLEPMTALAPEQRPTAGRSADFVNNQSSNWNIEPQMDYQRILGPGNLNLVLGSTVQQQSNNGINYGGFGFTTDEVMEDIRMAPNFSVNSTIYTRYKYVAYFARLGYDIQGKYLLNLSTRRDGSSRFGSKNKFNSFGAVGLGWVFSTEKFVQDRLKFLSFGKLRASYGTSGSDQISDYFYLNNFNPVGTGVAYQGAVGLSPSGHANPYIAWEETKKLNLGVDLGFLKERLLLTVNYNRNRSSNQILSSGLSVITGFGGVNENLPALVQNQGWEFTLNTTNIQTKKLRWSTSLNLTTADNELLEFPNLAGSTYMNSYLIGQPIGIAKVYDVIGIDPATGKFQFKRANGDIASTSGGLANATEHINLAPTMFGGVENSISYGNFHLDFLFQFTKRKGQQFRLISFQGMQRVNQTAIQVNRWREVGDISENPRATVDLADFSPYSHANTNSTLAFGDASFVRLKNVSLSWRLPEGLTSRLRMRNCSVFIQGQNLLTFTKYQGLDPETLSASALPTLRVVTTGFKFGL